MRLLLVKNKTKSDHSNKKLMKSVLHQKSFLGVIQSDTNTYILTLDTKIGEIDSLHMIISKLMPDKYTDTNLLLFLLVDKHFWYSQDYHFQLIPHME